MSQPCQYNRLQRFFHVFTQNHGRRCYSVEVGNNKTATHSDWKVINTSVPYIHRLGIQLCAITSSRNFSHRSGSPKNYYKILNLKPSASASEIKAAYFKLSKKHHPDLNESATSTAAFLDITEAYEVLSKENTREEYDNSISYRNTNYQPQHHAFDPNKFYSREKHWRESETYGKQKTPDPKDFDPFGFYDEDMNKRRKEEEPTNLDNMKTIFTCVLIAVTIYIISNVSDKSSRNDVRDPSVKMKKLESGALVSTVDVTKQDRISQCEKNV